MPLKSASLKKLAIAALAIVVSSTASAQIYKWVDAEGNVHFTDKKPSNGGQSVDVNPQQLREPDEGELRRRALLQRAEEDFAYQRSQHSAQVTEQAKVDSVAACKTARIEYGIVQEPMPIYRTDDDRLRPHWVSDTYQGGRRYLNDSDRQRTMRDAVSQIGEHCANPNNDAANKAAYYAWIDKEYCTVMSVELAQKTNRKSRTPRSEIEALSEEFSQQCS